MSLTQDNMSLTQDNMSLTQDNMSPKSLFLVMLSHGYIGSAAKPFKSNEHASTSLTPFNSVPKLTAYINCSPGTILFGEKDGDDNAVLMKYFKNNSSINFTDFTQPQTQTQTQPQIISSNFLKHVTAGIKELNMSPRERTETYRGQNKDDIDVCRNSFICDRQVGNTHLFVNKTFSIKWPPIDPWGIYIYNNNISPRITPGKSLISFTGMKRYIIKDSDEKPIAIEFDLKDIIENFNKLDLDILLLGYLLPVKMHNNYFKVKKMTGYNYHDYPNDLWGSQMYLINRRYANFLLTKYTIEFAINNLDKPYSPDWTITKNCNRAIIYPMLALEEGDNKSNNISQNDFHRKCFENNYDPDIYL